MGFFIVLGLGVVLLAMRGGPRGMRDTLERGRRRPLHVGEFAVAGVIALFGLAVPALVLLGGQAKAGPGGGELTTAQAHGRELFSAKCATCHTLKDANAVGKVGPDLDALAPTSGLTLDAIKQGRARGNGQMPAQLLDGTDARDVAKYIEDVAGR
ncbi:MAG: cytochrome [Solirubrobacteraceae bacterium]|nr:cytochrome [Solirubrobacteraceae bacterium]